MSKPLWQVFKEEAAGSMPDVTIPADTARRIAAVLRMHADTVPSRSLAATQWTALADQLDPPLPSLEDEVLAAVLDHGNFVTDANQATNDILAVVRRHVEAMDGYCTSCGCPSMLNRDDVLRLLGSDQ